MFGLFITLSKYALVLEPDEIGHDRPALGIGGLTGWSRKGEGELKCHTVGSR